MLSSSSWQQHLHRALPPLVVQSLFIGFARVCVCMIAPLCCLHLKHLWSTLCLSWTHILRAQHPSASIDMHFYSKVWWIWTPLSAKWDLDCLSCEGSRKTKFRCWWRCGAHRLLHSKVTQVLSQKLEMRRLLPCCEQGVWM